jgi:excinuclease ABC subunit C
LLGEWLSQMRGNKVSIHVPLRGEKRALLDLVRQDVDIMVRTLDERAVRQKEKRVEVQVGLVEIFGTEITEGLNRIEAYDISNINGVDSVGGMVVFVDGKPYKKGYRRFKIRTAEGADDTGSLQEVLFRRLRKAGDGSPGFDALPDLILMDGGKGQVNAALAVVSALGLSIPVAGMVKDDRHKTAALLYNGNSIDLRKKSALYAFIGTIQEEVHRFSVDYHRKVRGRALTHSVLDDIEGIGEKRKAALFAHFGSLDKIKAASIQELTDVQGMNKSAAKAVFQYFTSGLKRTVSKEEEQSK